MNEICGACRQYTREDDSLVTYHSTSIGIVQACLDCGAEFTGSAVASATSGVAPVTYPVGSKIPDIGDGLARRKIRVCGICRRALRWNDDGGYLRLAFDDVWGVSADGVYERLGPQEGAYAACSECVAAWRPVIFARLIREGILKPDVTVEMMPEDALM